MKVDVVEVAHNARISERPPAHAGFAFLTCVTDMRLFARLVASVEALRVPRGFAVAVFFTTGVTSLASAYNRLQSTSARWRYKAYIHQDATVLNDALIPDVVRLFRRRQVGLIGAAGCRYLPESCIWWNGSGIYGRVLELNTGNALDLGEPAGEYERVEAVDGLCMITQHDVPWDEEIAGFHFYDVAQSARMVEAGYDVIVPYQEQPWFGHDATVRDEAGWAAFFTARDAFRERYRRRTKRRYRSRLRRARRLVGSRVSRLAG